MTFSSSTGWCLHGNELIEHLMWLGFAEDFRSCFDGKFQSIMGFWGSAPWGFGLGLGARRVRLAFSHDGRNIAFLPFRKSYRQVVEFQESMSVCIILGGEHPTNRGCGLVHPLMTFTWTICPHKNPKKSPGWTNPQPRFVGWTTKYAGQELDRVFMSTVSEINRPNRPELKISPRCVPHGAGILAHRNPNSMAQLCTGWGPQSIAFSCPING